MKAAVRTKYGDSSVLTIQDVDKPSPKHNELLIKVLAASVNRSDVHVLTGKPFIMRLFTGLSKPRFSITGVDFAGEIEVIGSSVTAFKKGDRVMGLGGIFGCRSHAQYMVLPEAKATKACVTIPEDLTYEQAAACTEGAFYAASTVNQLPLKQGEKALVYGATGSIGCAYIQFLKYFGLYTTAVCGGEHTDKVKSWGANKVVDYKVTDFTNDSEQYDYVFDAVGKSSFAKCKKLLKKKGIYTSSGGAENLFLSMITPFLGGKKVPFLPPKELKKNLTFIRDLVESGNFKPVIDRVYPLEKIGEAFTYVASGQKIGNVIVTMDN